MKRIAAALAVALAVTPALAQEDGKGEMREGLSLLEEGTKLLLRGLMKEMEPALTELEEAIDDLNAYHPPEMLPNGDIIIRRKEPLPVPPEEDGAQGEIEL